MKILPIILLNGIFLFTMSCRTTNQKRTDQDTSSKDLVLDLSGESHHLTVKVHSVPEDEKILRKVIGSDSRVKFQTFCDNARPGNQTEGKYEYSSFVKEISFDNFLNGTDGIQLDFVSTSSNTRWSEAGMRCKSWVSKDDVVMLTTEFGPTQDFGAMVWDLLPSLTSYKIG